MKSQYTLVSIDTVLLSFSDNRKSLLRKYPEGKARACSRKVGRTSFNPFSLSSAADCPIGLAVRIVVNRTPANGNTGVILLTVSWASSLMVTPTSVGRSTTWSVDMARP